MLAGKIGLAAICSLARKSCLEVTERLHQGWMWRCSKQCVESAMGCMSQVASLVKDVGPAVERTQLTREQAAPLLGYPPLQVWTHTPMAPSLQCWNTTSSGVVAHPSGCLHCKAVKQFWYFIGWRVLKTAGLSYWIVTASLLLARPGRPAIDRVITVLSPTILSLLGFLDSSKL
jgi:hypothetical protein